MDKIIQLSLVNNDDATFNKFVSFLESQPWLQVISSESTNINVNTNTNIHNPSRHANETTAEQQITAILRKIGVPANVKGYGYLRDAILYVLAHQNEMGSITKVLYPYIAKKNQTNAKTVERAMRHAIERGWDSGGKEKFYSLLGFEIAIDKRRPSNSEFIASVSDYIYTNNL